jgi:alpha-tubulin suppressor-like RCC1 family protein
VVVTQSKPVFTWGQNYNGSLGLGDTIVRSSPVQIGTSSWIMVSAGYSTTVGIRADGALYTWGSAASGSLGNGTTVGDRSSPIAIGASSWNYAEAGWGNNFAIRTDGGLFAWGINTTGKLGVGDITLRNSPVQVGSSSWTMVSSSNLTSGAIDINNRLFMWGIGGTLGQGATSTNNRSSPVQVIAGTPDAQSRFTQIAVGQSGSVAIDINGLGYFWGLCGLSPAVNYNIPWKNNITVNLTGPVPLSTFSNETDESNYLTATGKTNLSWRQAVGNAYGGLCLRSDGKIYIWGGNSDTSLGINSTSAGDWRIAPQLLLPGSTFNFIAAGGDQGTRPRYHAIGTDGILYSWGNNFAGSLGVGDSTRRAVPTAVNITSSFVFVAGGCFNTAAIATDGSLFTWGQGTNGALGNGTTTGNVFNPTKIGSSSWYRVSIGRNFMNGITGAYKLFSWGIGTSGVIGDGTATTRSVPTAVGASSWIFVSSGNSSAFAIRSDSTLWAWGNNHVGQLGLGDTIARSSPVQIASPANWKYVDAQNTFSGDAPLASPFYRTYGIASDNTLYAWGFFDSGTGLTAALNGRSSPVQISASQYSMVKSGHSFVVAVKTNGVQYYWGKSDTLAYSPIYDNSNGAYSTLQFVQSNWESFNFVASGSSNGAAIRSDYKLFTWGRDEWGQLGTGSSNVTRSNPVQIGSSSWTQVAVGNHTMYAIDTRARLFTWGLGGGGEMGNNSVLSTSSPVQLGSSSWTMVKANRSYVMALRV